LSNSIAFASNASAAGLIGKRPSDGASSSPFDAFSVLAPESALSFGSSPAAATVLAYCFSSPAGAAFFLSPPAAAFLSPPAAAFVSPPAAAAAAGFFVSFGVFSGPCPGCSLSLEI